MTPSNTERNEKNPEFSETQKVVKTTKNIIVPKKFVIISQHF